MGRERITIKDLRGGKREVHQVAWPGTERMVGLMLLRGSEIQEGHFAAVDHFKMKVQPVDGVSLGEFIREKERQEVFRMLLQPESEQPGDRLFAKADLLRGEVDLEEVAYFQREHERLMGERLARLGLLPKPAAIAADSETKPESETEKED